MGTEVSVSAQAKTELAMSVWAFSRDAMSFSRVPNCGWVVNMVGARLVGK